MPRTCLHCGLAAVFLICTPASSQLQSFPYTESFDSSTVLPAGWETAGFGLTTSAPRSSPHCLIASGNSSPSHVISGPIDGEFLRPISLEWYERRSASARTFVLEVFGVANSDRTLLAAFDSIPTVNVYHRRQVDLILYPLLSSQDVRFEFRIRPDSTNNTGVLRLDDVHLTPTRRSDGAVLFVVRPLVPTFAGTPTLSTVNISNLEELPMAEASVGVRVTFAGENIPILDRRFPLPFLGQGTSTDIPFPYTFPAFGSYRLTAGLYWQEDQNDSNDVSQVIVDAGYAPGSIVVTEIMFAPVREDEPEWVEVYNPGTMSVDVNFTTLSDKGSQRTPVSPNSFLVPPASYAVIASFGGLEELYPTAEFPVTIARFPSLNNTTADAVVVRDLFGNTLDSVWYEPAWATPGTSLERRDWNLPSLDRETWSSSTDTGGGSPGRSNSVQRHDKDGGLLYASVEIDPTTDAASVLVSIVNHGRMTLPEGEVTFFADVDHSLRPGEGEEFTRTTVFPLQSADSVRIRVEWLSPPPGSIAVAAILSVAGDTNPSNDTATTVTELAFKPGVLLVNEIMFDPLPGESEWIELYNRSEQPIEIYGWTVTDRRTPAGSQTTVSIGQRLVIPSGEYGIVAGDSSMFESFGWLKDEPYRSRVVLLNRTSGLGLNSDEDLVVLKDLTGLLIDSVAYSGAWHQDGISERGRSLERIRYDLHGADRRSWTSAPGPFGGSPGRQNLALPEPSDVRNGLSIAPNPFSPDGDGYEDIAYLKFTFPAPTVFIRARIFDDSGVEQRVLTNGELFSGSDMILWDGRTGNGSILPIGPYIALFEAWNPSTGFSATEKKVVVVVR